MVNSVWLGRAKKFQYSNLILFNNLNISTLKRSYRCQIMCLVCLCVLGCTFMFVESTLSCLSTSLWVIRLSEYPWASVRLLVCSSLHYLQYLHSIIYSRIRLIFAGIMNHLYARDPSPLHPSGVFYSQGRILGVEGGGESREYNSLYIQRGSEE